MTASTRSRLIAAAQEVIATDGWAAATTRRVAETAGVNPGLVHYHAGTIDDLRRDAMLEGIQGFFADSPLGAPSAAPASLASTLSWVRALIDIDAQGTERERLARLLQESLIVAGRDPVVRTRVGEILRNYRRAFADGLAARGVQDPVGTAGLIAVVVDGLLLQRMLDPDLDAEPILAGIDELVTARTVG